jgi:mono/diheme cytochrome c family protein
MAADAATIEKGKKVYAEAKPLACKTCHSVAGVGNAKGPLDDAGKLSAADIKAWIRTPKEMTAKAKATRKPPMPAYPPAKLSDENLDALTAYLLTLKK